MKQRGWENKLKAYVNSSPQKKSYSNIHGHTAHIETDI